MLIALKGLNIFLSRSVSKIWEPGLKDLGWGNVSDFWVGL